MLAILPLLGGIHKVTRSLALLRIRFWDTMQKTHWIATSYIRHCLFSTRTAPMLSQYCKTKWQASGTKRSLRRCALNRFSPSIYPGTNMPSGKFTLTASDKRYSLPIWKISIGPEIVKSPQRSATQRPHRSSDSSFLRFSSVCGVPILPPLPPSD